jgi:hypothetical protein
MALDEAQIIRAISSVLDEIVERRLNEFRGEVLAMVHREMADTAANEIRRALRDTVERELHTAVKITIEPRGGQ